MVTKFLKKTTASVSNVSKSANFFMTQDPKKIRAVPSLHEIRSNLGRASSHTSSLMLSSSYHLSSCRTRALLDHRAAVANVGRSAVSSRRDLAGAKRHLRGDRGAHHRPLQIGSMFRHRVSSSRREPLPVATTRAVSLLVVAWPPLGNRSSMQRSCNLGTTRIGLRAEHIGEKCAERGPTFRKKNYD